MTLQQLRYILELSKHNSISAAAQALNISQPSLSTAIRDLEKEFSLTLVERNRHGITFTPAGLEFLHYAGHILSHAAAMHDHFQAEKDRTCPRSCPSLPSTIPLPMKPSSMPCNTSSRASPAYSPCAKGGRRRSSTTSSPARAIWASSSCPI